MTTEIDPIAAVTAGDPGCHYRPLAEHAGLTWNERHGFWVAAHPDVAREVLSHPDCLVRPAREPVPARLAGGAAGRVFGNLARMQDGEGHARAKRAITTALDAVDLAEIRGTVSRLAEPAARTGDLHRTCFEVPVRAVASLLGAPDATLDDIARWTAAFVTCTTPVATDLGIQQGVDAAERLWTEFDGLLKHPEPSRLLGSLRRAFHAEGLGHEAAVANAIGLLFQTHDATAGLIGNAIVRLARSPEEAASSEDLVAEVARRDPSVHNTRRFVARDTVIAGQTVRRDAAILVVLAAAGEIEPERFWAFGHGRHACPGRALALEIASEAIECLRRHNAVPAGGPDPLTCCPMTNVRIPAFPSHQTETS